MKKEFILSVEGVNKTFEGFKAISDFNFYMDQGELRTVIGPNGAGKTTLLDLITGRCKPDSGKIEFEANTDLTRLNEYEINRLGIGRKFQTPSVYTDHTVYENILLSLESRRGVFSALFARILSRITRLPEEIFVRRGVFSALFARITSEQQDKIHEILKTVGLADKAEWIAGNLAHGQKQWLEIGMLLAQNPKLLLVDEPTAGMTDEETARTGELLISLVPKHSVVVIEHDMVFVRQIARKVTVLHQGGVLCEGTVDEVQKDKRVIEVYLGRQHEPRSNPVPVR